MKSHVTNIEHAFVLKIPPTFHSSLGTEGEPSKLWPAISTQPNLNQKLSSTERPEAKKSTINPNPADWADMNLKTGHNRQLQIGTFDRSVKRVDITDTEYHVSEQVHSQPHSGA